MMNLKEIKPLIGRWKTSGEIQKTPMGPAGKLRGHDTYEWGPHKDFVLHTVNVRMGSRKIKNCEVMSFDPKKRKLALYAFNDAAVAGLQQGELKGRKWSIDGGTLRFRGEFDAMFKNLNGEWQYKTKGQWKLYMTLKLRRR